MGEMLFLRGFTHFRLKEFFKYIPYMDETITGTSADFEAVRIGTRTIRMISICGREFLRISRMQSHIFQKYR